MTDNDDLNVGDDLGGEDDGAEGVRCYEGRGLIVVTLQAQRSNKTNQRWNL